MRKIELLAPAKDLECGKIAIDCGADAVYIGAPKFSARSAAHNSIEDITELINYAHRFHARVYVALNTILFDSELDQAVKTAWDVYHAGADALIIQDLGLLECDLPPIPLHASTQLNNQTPEKVLFLQDVGFQQVVLARELSLNRINVISESATVPLEYFIHGALCVSYSGQCSISQAKAGRSGNRGQCSQFCRHRYTLTDSNGKTIAKDKYLLSLKDLNLSGRIEDLLDAGISSLKIEGRLKDASYVKNITAHYRQELDAILERRPEYCRASDGKVQCNFETDPEKTFNRKSSSYFLDSRLNELTNQQTPKFAGIHIGHVAKSWPGKAELKTNVTLANGDGLAYYSKTGELNGVRVSATDGTTVLFNTSIRLAPGTQLYRNTDVVFERQLAAGKAVRKISATITLTETGNDFTLIAKDESGCSATHTFSFEKQTAKNPQRAHDSIIAALSKTGSTIYTITSVEFDLADNYFFPNSVLNDARRDVLDLLTQQRLSSHIVNYQTVEKNNLTYPGAEPTSTYLDNISNAKSQAFYARHHLPVDELAYEVSPPDREVPLMITKYCLKYELNLCPRFQDYTDNRFTEPLFLHDDANKFRLGFDCKNCEMQVWG